MTNTYEGVRVLITGGLGFIGSTLAHALVRAGARVTLVDGLIPRHGGNLHNIRGIEDRVAVHIADVRDESGMERFLRGQEVMFNLAGQTSHMDSMSDPRTDMEINCGAQLSILEACRRVNDRIKIVFASTRQVYGRPEYLPVDERHPVRPVDVNGINKMAGESYHVLYHRVYGIRTCVLRLTNTYGPRMRIKDDRQTFLGIWIRSVLEGRPFEVWGGEQRRDLNFVDDAVDALLAAAERAEADGGIFNLGASPPITLQELAEALVAENGSGTAVVRPFPPERKAIDIGDYYSDYRLFSAATGWRPKIGLRDGLARTLEYFRANLEKYL